ncbi:transcriptional repressor [candidate division KSB1 bacterium]|nr:MAG: transcriptional repressor [candidate division KSB1 bacterium]
MANQGKKKFRTSKQRNRMLQLLRATDSHPTADWLYEELKKEFPRLSLGTVYRNLSLLIDMGLVKKIHFGSTFDRFEANTAPHYHLICERCGKIIDFDLPVYEDIIEDAKQRTTFTIHFHRIEFFGTCENCGRASQVNI